VPIDRKIRQYSIFIVLNSTQTFLKEWTMHKCKSVDDSVKHILNKGSQGMGTGLKCIMFRWILSYVTESNMTEIGTVAPSIGFPRKGH
jgi:hypothetical protein